MLVGRGKEDRAQTQNLLLNPKLNRPFHPHIHTHHQIQLQGRIHVPLPFVADDRAGRRLSLVYAADIARAVVRLLGSSPVEGSPTRNLAVNLACTEEPWTFMEIMGAIARELGVPPRSLRYALNATTDVPSVKRVGGWKKVKGLGLFGDGFNFSAQPFTHNPTHSHAPLPSHTLHKYTHTHAQRTGPRLGLARAGGAGLGEHALARDRAGNGAL